MSLLRPDEQQKLKKTIWVLILLATVLVILCYFTSLSHAECVVKDGLPDSKCTPGAVRAATTSKDICTPNFTSTIRDVPDSLKNKVYADYGMKGNDKSQCSQGFEVDHLVSLVLSGDNVEKNLWPQSYCGKFNAHNKDKLENYYHRQICAGKISQSQADHEISTNWVAAYKKYGLDKSGNSGTVNESQE